MDRNELCMDCGENFFNLAQHSKAEIKKLNRIRHDLIDKEQSCGLDKYERVLYKTIDIRTTALARNLSFNLV